MTPLRNPEVSPPAAAIIVKTSREHLHASSPEQPTLIIVKVSPRYRVKSIFVYFTLYVCSICDCVSIQGEEELMTEEKDRERDRHKNPHDQIKDLRISLKYDIRVFDAVDTEWTLPSPFLHMLLICER